MKCLLVKTKDNRKFLTQQKNLPFLTEFAKTFRAEIYLVEMLEGKVISELKTLAANLCNPELRPIIEARQLKRLYPESAKTRQNILKAARKIREFVQGQLLAGKTVALKDLKAKYKNCNITDACLCHHLSEVRKKLNGEGHAVKKVGQGRYCLDL